MGRCEWYGFCPYWMRLSIALLEYFSLVSGRFGCGVKNGKAGCVPVITDVHYLGLELSVFNAEWELES